MAKRQPSQSGQEYNRKLISGSALTFGGLVVAAGFAYLLRIVLARHLPTEEVGLFFSVLNFIIFVTLFQRLGTELSLVRYINVWRVEKQQNKIKLAIIYTFLFQFLVGLLYLLAIFLFSSYLATHYFKHPNAEIVLRLLSGLIILFIFEDLPRRIFQSYNRMFWFTFMESSKSLLMLLFVIAGFFYASGVLVAVISFLAATVVVSLIGVTVAVKTAGVFRGKIIQDFSVFKQLFLFSLPLIFLIIGNKVIDSIDLLVLTYFRDLTEVGVYSVVLPTAGLCLFFFRPFSIMALSLGTELWERKETERLKETLRNLSWYLLVAMLPIIFLLIFYAEFVLSLFFGEAYAAGARALQIILLGVFFFGIAHINLGVLMAVGNAKNAGKVMLFAALANFALNIALIPFFGMVGAALATFASYLLAYGISSRYVKKEIGFAHFLGGNDKFLRLVFSALVFAGVVLLLEKFVAVGPAVARVALVSVVSLLCYGLLINRTNVCTFAEMRNMVKLLWKKEGKEERKG